MRKSYALPVFFALLLLCGAVPAMDRYGKQCRRYAGPVTGINDPRLPRLLVDTPLDVYHAWKKLGVHGRTILLVTDRWKKLSTSELFPEIPMYRRYPLSLYRIPSVMEENYLTSDNYLYVAALNGITRRVVALLPAQGYAEMTHAAHSAKNSRIEPDSVYLTHQGFPRWFTTGGYLRHEHEPVLLYVEAAYFLEEEPEHLYRMLLDAGIRTDSLILCRGKGDIRITPREIGRLERFATLAGFAAGARSSLDRSPEVSRSPGGNQ